MKKLTPDPKVAGVMGIPSKPGLEARAGSKPLRDGGCYLQTGPIHVHMEAKEEVDGMLGVWGTLRSKIVLM
jgi:hypothetical protein